MSFAPLAAYIETSFTGDNQYATRILPANSPQCCKYKKHTQNDQQCPSEIFKMSEIFMSFKLFNRCLFGLRKCQEICYISTEI